MTKDAGASRRKREYLHWTPQKGERVEIEAHRWWARLEEFEGLGFTLQSKPPTVGLGIVKRRLPAWEIADYEVVVDGEGDELHRTYCYHYDELSRP